MASFAKRMDNVSTSAVREILKLMNDPEMISFGGGSPAKESFPVEEIKTITKEILENDSLTALQYGITEGYMPLIKSYLKYIIKPKQVTANEENVIILSGSNQGIGFVIDVLVDPEDVVLVESPTFLSTLMILDKNMNKYISVETDDNGIILSDLEEKIKKYKPKMLYTIPTFQNPTGKTLSVDRREKIAQLASKYDFFVLEDDPYCELRYKGEEILPIKHFDKTGHVILLNSFSKILAPGLRVGAAVAHKDIISKLVIAKQCSDTHATNLTQMICANYLEKGLLPKHLEEIRALYKKRMETMLECIEKEFPKGTKYTKPDGGLFIWVVLPQGYNTNELIKKATKEAKVAFVPGAPFFVDKSKGERTLRLNFSSSTPETIKIGMSRLGKIFK